MTDQQKHLKQVIEQQKEIVSQLNKLNEEVSIKREAALKLQGIIEYLIGTGVKLDDETDGEVVTNPFGQGKTK